MTTDVLPKALILAALLASGKQLSFIHHADAAAELRRLHAENHELLEALKAMLEVHGVTQEYADKHIEIPQSWVEVSNLSRAAIAKATGE